MSWWARSQRTAIAARVAGELGPRWHLAGPGRAWGADATEGDFSVPSSILRVTAMTVLLFPEVLIGRGSSRRHDGH